MKKPHTVHKGDRITQRWLAEERAAKVRAEMAAERAQQMAEWERAHWAAGNPDDLNPEPYCSDAAW